MSFQIPTLWGSQGQQPIRSFIRQNVPFAKQLGDAIGNVRVGVPGVGFSPSVSLRDVNNAIVSPQGSYASTPTNIYGPGYDSKGNLLGPTNFSNPTPPPSGTGGTYNPSTSGQPTGGGGSTPPTTSPDQPQTPQEDPYVSALRSAYQSSAQGIRDLEPGIDNTYNTTKTELGGLVTGAQQEGEAQDQRINHDYGDTLRKIVQTGRELTNARRNTYSALGSLDSSSYADAETKAQQNIGEQSGQLGIAQSGDLAARGRQTTQYINGINTQLAKLAQDYQSNKASLSQALASNDLSSAQSISQAIQGIQNQANNLNNFKVNLAATAAQYKSMGYDLTGALKGIGTNLSPFLNTLNNYAGNQYAAFYRPPSNPVQGQGYIAPNGRRYGSEDEYRRLTGL